MNKLKAIKIFVIIVLSMVGAYSHTPLRAQTPQDEPKPILVEEPKEPLEERLTRKITLDVRDMNIIDVVKFLALKGEFNVVSSGAITGRATLLLKRVGIKDALDIVLISNNLAYDLKNDIVHLMSAADYENLYGKKFADNRSVVIIHLNYAKPSYVLEALDGMKSALGKIIIDEDTGSVVLIDTQKALEEMQAVIVDLEQPLETFTYNLQYAKSDVVAEKLRPRLEANKVGTIVADERSNQLIVRAIPGRKSEVEQLIADLDKQTKEVLIEARILQIVFKPNFDLGIDWDLNFKDSPDEEIQKLSFSNVWLNNSGLSSSDNLSKFFTKVAVGNISKDHFQATLKALKQVSDTKILSNPRLLVTNGEEAKIHIGDTIPYIISTTSGTGDNAITSEDVRFVDVGIKLNVIPFINDEGFVTMRLKPEISTVTSKLESKGGGIPLVNKTEVETNIMVKDGNTVILGGLKSDDKSHIKRGLPGLGDVPVLGRFFSSTSDKMTSSEIVIFITPHIVNGAENYKSLRGTIKPFADYLPDNDSRKSMSITPTSPFLKDGVATVSAGTQDEDMDLRKPLATELEGR